MTSLEDFCENIDACIFSGDVLHEAKFRDMLKDYISRWTRAIDEHEAIDSTILKD